MMKKILPIIAILLSAMSVTAQIRLDSVKVVHNGGKAEISFDARIDKKATNRNHKLVMVPVVYNGQQSMNLAPIVVESHRTRILDARHDVEALPDAFLTAKGKTLHYTTAVDYKEWLPGADIRFDITKSGCCSEEMLDPIVLVDNLVVTEPGVLSIGIGGMIMILDKNAELPASYIAAANSEPIVKSTTDSFDIIFPLVGTRIDLSLFDNNQVTTKMLSALSSRSALEGKIRISGFASPEGTQARNYTLAQERAMAMRNYLLDNVHWLTPADIEVMGGGENWEALYKMIETSYIPGRWQALEIIKNTPAEIDYTRNTSRRKQLMDLNGGAMWRSIQPFFTKLRVATAVITTKTTTTETPDATPQIAENADLINQAIDFLGTRNSAQALGILNKVSEDPRAWNPMGVAYLLESDATKAREYFQKATDAGYNEAKSNMDQMR